MATFASALQQQTTEIHTYTIDYTNDLPTGGTVTAGTATHTPPSGSASSLTVTVSSPYVYVTVPAQTVTGVHYIDVLATFNNSDKSPVRLPVNVVYPATTARIGMLDLISELRSITEANAGDYAIAGVPYWSDKQLQDVLDQHRTDYRFVPLEPLPILSTGGTTAYHDYRFECGWLEQTTGGTDILYLQDSTGAQAGTALWTADYIRGVFTFASDTRGTAYYLTGRSYDMNASAADIWRRKTAHHAPTAFDFSTDNHSLRRSQVFEHCKAMADYFTSLSGDSINSVQRFRSDTW